MSEKADNIAREAVVRSLMQHLFADPALNTFAVLDGAAIPDLLQKLEEESPEHVCLYRGELEPDMAECAPYLVQLQPDAPFTAWLLAEGWGNHWGIFALAPTDLSTLRRHFRTLLMVLSPEGKRLYFRYYDPRVLIEFIPTCDEEQSRNLFGPVRLYVCAADSGAVILFGVAEGRISRNVQHSEVS